MDLEALKTEYQEWKKSYGIEIESDSILLMFLKERGYLSTSAKTSDATPPSNPYILLVRLCTDWGDYHCSFDHPNLRIEGVEDYLFSISWKEADGENARNEAIELLQQIKESTYAHKDSRQEEVHRIFDRSIESIKAHKYADVRLGGNYDGTIILFTGPGCEANPGGFWFDDDDEDDDEDDDDEYEYDEDGENN